MKLRRPMAVILTTTDGLKAIVPFKQPLLAVAFAERVLDQIDNLLTLDVVDRLRATKPDHSKEKLYGSLWCPYCHEWRHFDMDNYLGYFMCRVCEISEADYLVKTYNRIPVDGIRKTYDSPQEEAKAARRAARRLKRKRETQKAAKR